MTDVIDLDSSSPMKPTDKAATVGTSSVFSDDELFSSPTTSSKVGLNRAKRPAPDSKSSPKAKKQVSNSLGDEFDLDISLSSDDDIGTFKKPVPKPKSKAFRSTGSIAEPKKITKVHGGIAKSLSEFIMGPNFKMPERKKPTPEPKPAEKAKSLPTPTSTKAGPKSAKAEPAAPSKTASAASTRPVSFSVKDKNQKKPNTSESAKRDKGRTKSDVIASRLGRSREEAMQVRKRVAPSHTPHAVGQSAKPSPSTATPAARPAARPRSVARPAPAATAIPVANPRPATHKDSAAKTPAAKTSAAWKPVPASQRTPTTQRTPTQRPTRVTPTSQAQTQSVDAKERARIEAERQIQRQLKSLLSEEQWAQHQANLRKAKADMEKQHGSSNVVILDSPPRASGSLAPSAGKATSSRAPTPQVATPNTAPRSGVTYYAGTTAPYHASPAPPHTPVHTTGYGPGAPGYYPPPAWCQGIIQGAVKAHPFPGYCGNTPTDQHRPQSMSPQMQPHSPYGLSPVPLMQTRAPQKPSASPRVQVPATQSSPVIILDSPPLKSAPLPQRSQETTPTPTEKPVEKPAEEAEEPTKESTDKSTEKSAEKPAEKPADESTDKSTEKSAEQPIAQSDAASASASSPAAACSPSAVGPTTDASPPATTTDPVVSSPVASNEPVAASTATTDTQTASPPRDLTPGATCSPVAESTVVAASSPVPVASSPVATTTAPAVSPPSSLSPMVAAVDPASPPRVTSSSPFGPLSPVAATPAPASPTQALSSPPVVSVSAVQEAPDPSSSSPFGSLSPTFGSPVAVSPVTDEPLSPVRADPPIAESPIEISSPIDLSSPEPAPSELAPSKTATSTSSLKARFITGGGNAKLSNKGTRPQRLAMPKFVVTGAPSASALKPTANKKELKDANKKRSSHRDTKHELTTFLDERLKLNKKLFQALETQRKELDVPEFKYHSPPLVAGCDFSQIVYDRHYTCVYNQEQDVYYPVAPGTKREDFAVIVFTAKELMRVAELENGMEIMSQIRKSPMLQECKSVVLLTQGLEKGLVSLLHAAESDKHKKQQAEITATAYTSKKDLSGNEEKVRRVRHFVNTLYLTLLFKPIDFNTDKELAEYICQMHLGRSLQPYRQKLELYSSETKSYKTRKECLRSMMEQQKRVNLQAAKNISDQYASPQALAKAFDEKGPKLLVGTGSTAAKTMGPITSDYIYQLFTCKDPTKEIFSQL